MVADRDKPASDGYGDGKDKILLIVREANPLEYTGRIKLDAVPLSYALCSFHLCLSRTVATGGLPCPSVRKRDDTSNGGAGPFLNGDVLLSSGFRVPVLGVRVQGLRMSKSFSFALGVCKCNGVRNLKVEL